MEELLELQRQLAALQNVSTQNRLSDRIIIDLVDKLIKEYDLQAYHSTDGQTLMTPTYLSQTIHSIILQNGRCQLGQLPEQLGVGYERLEAIVERDSNQWHDVVRVHDVLLSQGYIASLCESIDELLQQRQELHLSEVISQFNLPMNFFKQHVFATEHAAIIQGVLNGDKLTTLCYMEVQRARLRGILRSSVRPVSLTLVAKEYGFDETLTQQLAEQLVRDNQVDGKVHQGQFIPTRFLKNQETITRRFFNQNNYIEYEMLSKQLNVQKPKDFLRSTFKDDFIPLETCGFNRQALPSLKDQITELLLSEGYTDLQVILPTALKQQDIELLLFQHMDIGDAEYVNSLIFSNSHIDKLAEKFKPKIVETIYKQPQKLIEQVEKPPVEDNIQASAGGFAKKGKNKGKQPVKENKKSNANSDLFTADEIFDYLVQTKEIERDDALPELYQFLAPKIQKLYEQVKVELFEKKNSASSELVQELQRRIEDISLALSITVRSIDTVQRNYSKVDVRLLVDSCLYGYRLLVENIVVLICKKFAVQVPPNLFINEEAMTSSQQLQQTQAVKLNCGTQVATKIFKNKMALSQALDMLPKDQSRPLKEMMDLCLKKALNDLQKYFMNNSDKLGVKVVLDKKTEKNFQFFIKYTNKDFLKGNQHDAQACLIKVLEFILIEKFGMYFIGNSDDKFNNIITQVAYESFETEEKQSPTKKEEKPSADLITFQREALKLLQQILNQMETNDDAVGKSVQDLTKLAKL